MWHAASGRSLFPRSCFWWDSLQEKATTLVAKCQTICKNQFSNAGILKSHKNAAHETAVIKEKRQRHFSYFRITVSKTSFWKVVQTQGHNSCVLGLWVTSEETSQSTCDAGFVQNLWGGFLTAELSLSRQSQKHQPYCDEMYFRPLSLGRQDRPLVVWYCKIHFEVYCTAWYFMYNCTLNCCWQDSAWTGTKQLI